MSKKMKGIILMFVLLVVMAIIFLSSSQVNFFEPNFKKNISSLNQNYPAYQGQTIRTDVYNFEGLISYSITAQSAKRYLHETPGQDLNQTENITWFTQPVMVLFDKVSQPDWSVKADKAKLVDDQMLYLYAHVELTSLATASDLKKITTESAEINLVTQDVSSNELINLYGVNFSSSGMKMRGNLRKREANLLEKVKTNYEIYKENP